MRRFGRQQKRKLREELAQCQTEINRLNHFINVQRELHRESVSECNYVRRNLAANSAWIPPQITNLVVDQDSFVATGPEVIRSPAAQWEMEQMLESTIKYVPMHVLTSKIVEDTNNNGRSTGMIHMYVKLKDGQMAYAISEEGIAMTNRSHLVDVVSRQLAEGLTRWLKDHR